MPTPPTRTTPMTPATGHTADSLTTTDARCLAFQQPLAQQQQVFLNLHGSTSITLCYCNICYANYMKL
uniref:Uncharacterized protein n=1 Tax=Oryza sativa subsp. japonica TaxID=39947 RepID=Q67UF7_ORYSJ|nr:hypothetical protein [Oryza sativa Japonica Group]